MASKNLCTPLSIIHYYLEGIFHFENSTFDFDNSTFYSEKFLSTLKLAFAILNIAFSIVSNTVSTKAFSLLYQLPNCTQGYIDYTIKTKVM